MSYCCSQCSFTAQFESALLMHHQLHHEGSPMDDFPTSSTPKLSKEKSITLPRVSPPSSPFFKNKDNGIKLPSRTLSATRMLGKLKARICKSKTLFAHPEATENAHNLSILSGWSSKCAKVEESRGTAVTSCSEEQRETYACHLCSFEADRITVLDRHLLNDHKIGLENLLKLVMAKTKDGLSDDRNSTIYGIRQPYYRPQNEIIEEGEFIIETVTPTIRILKHASTNTDQDCNGFNLELNCQMISKEIENLLSDENKYDSKDFLTKMQTLNECMCKFVNSSNALKKVLTKEFDSKMAVKESYNGEPFFHLGLGDRESPRYTEKAQSEKMERSRNKYMDNCRAEKSKPSAESFYF